MVTMMTTLWLLVSCYAIRTTAVPALPAAWLCMESQHLNATLNVARRKRNVFGFASRRPGSGGNTMLRWNELLSNTKEDTKALKPPHVKLK